MHPPTMCCQWESRCFLRVIIFSMTGSMFVILVLDEGVLYYCTDNSLPVLGDVKGIGIMEAEWSCSDELLA